MTEIKPFPPALSRAYQVWKQNSFPAQEATFTALARDGQAPDFMVISCCDSRVLPTDIFGAGAGDMFVHRNIANIVPPYAAPSGDRVGDAHGTSGNVTSKLMSSFSLRRVSTMNVAPRCGCKKKPSSV